MRAERTTLERDNLTAGGRIDQQVFNTICSRSLVYNAFWEDPAVGRQALRFHDEWAREPTRQDQVHTCVGFHIADLRD